MPAIALEEGRASEVAKALNEAVQTLSENFGLPEDIYWLRILEPRAFANPDPLSIFLEAIIDELDVAVHPRRAREVVKFEDADDLCPEDKEAVHQTKAVSLDPTSSDLALVRKLIEIYRKMFGIGSEELATAVGVYPNHQGPQLNLLLGVIGTYLSCDAMAARSVIERASAPAPVPPLHKAGAKLSAEKFRMRGTYHKVLQDSIVTTQQRMRLSNRELVRELQGSPAATVFWQSLARDVYLLTQHEHVEVEEFRQLVLESLKES